MALTVLITSPTLGVRRLGADEPDSAWIPTGIWWESQIPGGWKGGGFNLRQRIDEDLGLRLLDEVEIIDEHGQTMYEGRIVKLPRQHGDDFLLGVECLGWASHMLDDPSVPYLYVDRDLSHWGEPSRARTFLLVAAATAYIFADWTASQAPDPVSGIASLVHQTGRLVSSATRRGIAEHWYNSHGIELGSLFYEFASKSLGNGVDTAWTTQALLSDDDVHTNTQAGTDHNGADGPVSATLSASGVAKYFATVQTHYDGTLTQDGIWTAFWRRLAVFGNQGLTKQGTAPDEGYYIDDMLVHALNLGAPKLTAKTVANGGLVEAPGVVVTQAADVDFGTVERIVLDLNKYVLFEWGVYENREFFYRETNPDRLCWEARLDQGIHLGLEGDDAEHALNGMIVRYTLGDGTARVAGPTGSGLDVESDLLADTDTTNTVNQHGYAKKWGDQTISFPLGDDSYATTIGAAYLAQSALPARSGNIDEIVQAIHPTKGSRPGREIKAGDWVRLSDHPTDVPRRIIGVRHDDDSGKTTVSVGNDINRVDAILEELGVVTRIAVG